MTKTVEQITQRITETEQRIKLLKRKKEQYPHLGHFDRLLDDEIDLLVVWKDKLEECK